MQKIELLDYPPIPDEFLCNSEKLLHYYRVRRYDTVSDELFHYLQTQFKDPITVCFAVIHEGMAPHKDTSGRSYGYNYLIEPGGSNVITSMYDENLCVTQQIVCQKNHWYKLRTDQWHSVHGIEPGKQRLFLSITYKHDYTNPMYTKAHCHPSILNDPEWVRQQNQILFQQLGI